MVAGDCFGEGDEKRTGATATFFGQTYVPKTVSANRIAPGDSE